MPIANLLMVRDASGGVTYGLPFSSGSCTTLATGVEQTLTVPDVNEKGYLAIFSFEPGSSVWVSDGTITLPTGSFASTLAQLNPGARQVNKGATLYFKTNDATAQVGVSFYAL